MKPVWKPSKIRIPTTVSILILAVLLLVGSFCGVPAALGEASEGAPDQIVLTWTEDPATSQTITWLMSDDMTAQLQYMPAEEFNDNFASASIIEVQGNPFDSTHHRYQADISELTPDTSYFYRVGCEGAWSETLSFCTAADTDAFTFLYLGDVQEGYTEWGNLLDVISNNYPQIKFSLLGGDITDNGSDETEWGEFLDAAYGYFSKIPLMPTLGNHDGSMYLNFFSLPANGPTDLEKEFYSFDYGNAHFVVLNSNNNTNEAAKQWLQADLQSSTKTWKFAMFHHPAYPAFEDNKTIDESICENWVPILEQYGVDMVFVGHQHQYMRTYPMYQGQIQDDPDSYGIVYVMGNAGTKVYASGGDFPYIACEETGSNYQIIDIDGSVLNMTSKNADGELIENYTIDKSALDPPILQADTTDNTLNQQIEITFEDDEEWRDAIDDITVNGNSINGSYIIDPGLISICAEVFTTGGDYQIVVSANGYADATVIQPIKASIVLDSPVSEKEYNPGQIVIIKGTTEEIDRLNIEVKDPDGNSIYGPEDIEVDNGVFETSLTLPGDASSGTYSIVLNSDDIPVPLISSFEVGGVILTISGDGVSKTTSFTRADLAGLDQVQTRYSTINTWPTKKMYVASGVKLSDLLAAAGISDEAKLIKFLSKDGYSMTFTVKELLQDSRWYYPGIKENHEYFGYIDGSTAGAEEVDTILALQSAESDDFAHMDDSDAPLLVMGQRWISEQTNSAFAKYVKAIEVSTAFPDKWENPIFTPVGGEVPIGTRVELTTSDMDGDNIYYTTDGSDPGHQSTMYNWIKKRWWNSRSDELADINHPIEITQDMTVKAVAIGFGKDDSEIVTSYYQVTIPPMLLNTPVNGQEYKKGQKVTIQGSSDEINQLNISVKDPDENTVYGPEEVALVNGLFETSFTLSTGATTGTYTIILDSASLPAAVTSTFTVKGGNGGGSGVIPDEDVILTITGNGVSKTQTFTLAQLQDRNQHQKVYSVINTWPTKKWYVGEGVKLADLLDLAGIKPGAQLIRFTAEDGFSVELTVKELLRDPRYYFPGFKDGGADADGHIPGSSAGAQKVDSIIALLSAEGTQNPDYMNDLNALLLMMGQRSVTEQTGQLFVKNLSKIEVFTASPSRWDTPRADPDSSEVTRGTLVKLKNNNMDDDKIYYTTDGSIPTIESPMYNWIASRWWGSRGEDVVETINHPIGINQDTTIKAITIGPGKLDSEVVTFTYQVKKDITSSVSPSQENTISLDDEVIIIIPENAIKEAGNVEFEIAIVDSPPAIPDSLNLISGVYEFTVDGSSSFSFNKNISLTLKFDISLIGENTVPAIYYYDEVLDKWINIGGTIEKDTITVEIDHFTKFAVMAAETEQIEKLPVTDIKGHWAQEEIEQLIAAGAIEGYPDDTFKPDNTINRAEFVTMLVKAFKVKNQGDNTFADTAVHWSKDYIASAVASGIITGYNSNVFGPDDLITREQMAVIIFRAAKLPLPIEEMQFADNNSISLWARDALTAVINSGIMKGYPNNTIQPQDSATRAEAVMVIVNALNSIEERQY